MARKHASRRGRSLRASRKLQSPELLEVRAAPGGGIAGLMVGAAWFDFGDRSSEGFGPRPDGRHPLDELLGATCLSDRTFRPARAIGRPEGPRHMPLSIVAALQRSSDAPTPETGSDPTPAGSIAWQTDDVFAAMYSRSPRRLDSSRFADGWALAPGSAATGDPAPAPGGGAGGVSANAASGIASASPSAAPTQPAPRDHGAIRPLRLNPPPRAPRDPDLGGIVTMSGGSGGSGGEVPIAVDDTGPGGSGGIVFMNGGPQNPYFTWDSNDYDIRSNDIYSGEVTITKKADPALGTATISGAGLVTYTPNENECGPDDLTYTLSNQYGESNEATIFIRIVPHLEFISDSEDENSTLGEPGSEVYLPNDDEYAFKISPFASEDTSVGAPLLQPSVFGNVSFAITAGNGDGFFRINSATGEIQLDKPAEDWGTDTSKTIEIEVSGQFADVTETDTANVTVTLLPAVGVAGDIHAVEGSGDDIKFRIARPRGDRSEAITVYFTIAWASSTEAGLHPDDFQGNGHDIFSGPSVTYHAEYSSGDTACYSVTIAAGAYYTAEIVLDLIGGDSDEPAEQREEARIRPIAEPSSGGSGGSGGSSDPAYVLSPKWNVGELPGLDAQRAYSYLDLQAFEAVTAFGGDPQDNAPPVSITISDVDQGHLNDCWLMATILGAVHKDTDIIKSRISESDSSGGRSFTVSLYNLSGGGDTAYQYALPSQNVLRNGLNMADFDDFEACGGSGGSFNGIKIWPQLLELAFTEHLGSNTYASIEGHNITNGVVNAWKSLTNNSATSKAASSIGDGGDQAIFDEILAQWGAPKTVLIGTYGDQKCDEGSGEPLAKSHAYVVTSVETEPDEKIELDNPWHGGQRITWIAKDRLSEEVKTVYVLD